MKHFIIRIIVISLLLCAAVVTQAAKTRGTLFIQLTGIKDPLEKNVMLSLQNFKNQLHYPLTETEVKRFRHEALNIIKNAIAPFGYFKPAIQSDIIYDKQGWLVRFYIKTGRPILITSSQLIVNGSLKTNHLVKALLANLPLKKGSVLNTEKYKDIKTNLYDIAIKHGYFDAKIEKNQIVIDIAKYQASVIIIFQSGERYRFGDTTFSKTNFDPRFLQRFLMYRKGELYNAKKLEKTQEELVNSNYFSQVLMKPIPQKAIHYEIPIHIALISRKAKQYTLGFGYGSGTGMRGTLGIALRKLGHWGHRFNALLLGSQDNSSVIAKYLMPGKNPARDTFFIETGISKIKQSSGSGRNGHIGLAYTLSSGHWEDTLSLTYLNERYDMINIPRTSTELIYPTLTLNYKNADHPFNPTEGVGISMQFTGANKEFFLTRSDFFQVMLHLKSLYTLDKTSTRFLFRSDLGYTNIANLGLLPLSLQLAAGGPNSVRGFSYNSIAPGRNLIVASTEIQQRIYGDWYVAGFCDAGVVGNQNLFHHVNVGVGPGIVWLTPIGALELSVANAITQSNKPWAIEFMMGGVLS